MKSWINLVLSSVVFFSHSFSSAAVTVTVNGSNHTIPQTNERGWGANVTAWIQAISSNTLQPSGGTFTLTSDVNFGASYGLKSAYFSTRSSNPSGSGTFRLSNAESIGWRNNGNSSNLLLSVNSSDQLTYNGVVLSSSTGPTFQDSLLTIFDNSDATKKIAFEASGITTGTTRTLTVPDANLTIVGVDTTQTLTNKTLTAPVISQIANTGTLTLPTSTDTLVGRATTDTFTNKTISADANTISNIDNNEIKANAAIDASKIADGSVSSAEFQYIGGLTSDAQTQLDAKIAKSTATTKGDLLVATASATVTRLGVGANGTFLKANSSATEGIEWGSVSTNLSVTTKTTTYTATTSDDVILADTSGGAWTLTLPTAVGNSGKIFRVKKTTSDTNLLTIDPNGSETLDGVTTDALIYQRDWIAIVSDNTNWQIVASGKASTWGTLKYAATTNCSWSSTAASMSAFSADTDCPTASVSGAASAPGTKIPGMVVSNIKAGTYRVSANSGFYAGASTSGAQRCLFEIYDGTSSGGMGRLGENESLGLDYGMSISGIFSYSSLQASKTFEIRANKEQGNSDCGVYASTADFVITIEPISN